MEFVCSNGTVLIDADDLPLLEGRTWRLHQGYARTGSGRARNVVAMHRLIMGAESGDVVDHINGNPSDNRRSNLRFCSPLQNTWNRKPHGDRPFKGVHGRLGRYRACIVVGGKQVALGGFATATEAALAYDVAAKKVQGEFARHNFNPDRDWLFPYAIADKAGRI